MCSDTNDIEADIQQNEGLIWHTLHKYYPQYLKDEDMVQELRITLWRCLEQYDETQGTSFSSYCVQAMVNRIRNIHRQQTLPNRIPSRLMDSLDAPISVTEDSFITLKDTIEAPPRIVIRNELFLYFSGHFKTKL